MKDTPNLPLIERILNLYGISLKAMEEAGGKVFQAIYADMVNLFARTST